ncbi:hypothetical protein Scel_36920 [Streptomyces cellostaticus]|nr:hypothetical protein Scel_36920 [Streptomyces cellostaticus]
MSAVGVLPAGCGSAAGKGSGEGTDGGRNSVIGASEGPSAAPSTLASGMGSDTGTDSIFPRTVTHFEGSTGIRSAPRRIAVLSTGPGLWWAGWAARPLGLGEETAAALGVRVGRVRLGLTALGVVLAATATGAVGPIGFVALTAPQPARRLTRTPHLPLLCSALTGAVVLVAADLAARTLLPPLEVPVGALTALVGGPYLLWLLGRSTAKPVR